MIRITDQYFWNFVFSLFFIVMAVMGAIVLQTESYRPLMEFELMDLVLITLATWRLIRLFIFDVITKFLREQFLDAKQVGKSIVLEKPARGPRRTIADLMSCPWCLGVWLAALVVFCYAMFPYAYFFVLFLALSAAATFLQTVSRLIGQYIK